jgi:hypothetical protein
LSNKKAKPKEWLPFIPIGVIVLMVVALVIWRNSDRGESSSDPPDQETGQTVATNDTHLDTEKDISDYYDTGDEPVVETPEPGSEEERYQLQQPSEYLQISCDSVAIYNGEFVESGRDEPVTDVAAILVTNKSEQYLDYVKLIYKVDGNEAVFVISGLPSGKSAWVLEDNGLKATSESEFVFSKVGTPPAYLDHVVRTPKEIEIKFNENNLMVKNISDETLNVIVYYRQVYQDGKFLGGIAYKQTFENLEPGQSATDVAGHMIEDWSSIIRVDVVKATDISE